MGPFVIRINDPAQLALDIGAYLDENNVKLFGEIRCRKVSYSKGEIITTELDPMERAELCVVQKPQSFKAECEQRLYAIVNTHCPLPLMASHLEVNLERPLPYIEVLSGH